MNSYADWLHGLADEGGKGVVNNIDARCLGRVADIIDTLEEKVAEYDAVFDIQWKADQRAIKMWQKATGEVLKWPDSAKLSVWLMGEIDERKKTFRIETAVLVAVAVVWAGVHVIFPEHMGMLYAPEGAME